MGEFDSAVIINSLETLHAPGSVVEIRIIDTPKDGTVSGYFNDFAKLAAAVEKYDGKDTIYVTMNAIKPDLLARADNRLKTRTKITTADHDVTRRDWLLVDLDAKRATGISSTEKEHDNAKEKASAIRSYLKGFGWPDPVICDSGNGWHLLYPIDEPNNAEMTACLQEVLQALDGRFSDDYVDVDLKCFNAARITKLYGTVACKGDNMGDRPHRRARIVHTPKSRVLVTTDQLKQMASKVSKPEPRPKSGPYEAFDLARWISSHGINVKQESTWKGTGRKWVLSHCPWNAEHNRGEAFIAQQPDGAITAGCRHNSCDQYGWRDLRLMYEPDAYDRQMITQGAPLPMPALPPVSSFGVPRTFQARELTQVDPTPAHDDWDGILTLSSSSLPSFPVDALPSILADHVCESSTAVQTPVDMQAMMILAGVASINSRRAQIQVGSASRQHIETLNLYIAIASDPGTRKSTALKTIIKPLDRLETELMREFGPERIAERDRWDMKTARIQALKGLAAKAKTAQDSFDFENQVARLREEMPDFPPAPPRLLVQDITTERLGALIGEQEDNCTALMSAEGGIFSLIKGQYNAKNGTPPSMDIYLKAWSGESHKIDRVGVGEIKIPAPMLTIGVMVQPGILRSLAADERLKENGFLDRFLYSVPDSLVGTRMYRDTGIYLSADYAYSKLVQQLWDLPRAITPDSPGKRFTITMTPDAIAVYAYCQDDIERRGLPDQDLAGMAGWASKLPGNVARIAANLHMVKCADEGRPWDTQMHHETMEQAWTIAAYLVQHAKEAFGEMRVDAAGSLAKRILKWAQRNNHRSFKFGKVYQDFHSTETKEKLEQSLLKLIDHHYIRTELAPRQPGQKGRTATVDFVINPAFLDGDNANI